MFHLSCLFSHPNYVSFSTPNWMTMMAVLGIDHRDLAEKDFETRRRQVDKWREKLSVNSLTAKAVVIARDILLRGV